MTNSVVPFEIPADDKKRVKKFYETVFGWKMTQLGPDMDDYLLANTTEIDQNGMVKTPGNINGGFIRKAKEAQRPTLLLQ